MASAAPAQGGWNADRSAAGPYSPWLIVAIISLPTFMEVLDTSVANVSLANIAGGLSVSTDQATWVLTSYLVANAVIIPISGWLSDAIGRKRYFLISIALFTLASLMCGISPNLQTLIVARILQGIGGGGLAPVEQSILADTFPPRQRGMAFAAFAIVVVVGPVLGPTIGGWITDTVSWHWIFLVNVPVGFMAFALAQTFVDEPEAVKADRRQKLKGGLRIDALGVLFVFLGLGFLELTLDRGEREDWFASGTIVASALIAVVSLVILMFWEWSHDDPVVDVRLLKNRNFGVTTLAMFTTGMILFGTTQLIPQMLQQVLGYSALNAGLALTSAGVATLVMVPVVGRLTGATDARYLIFFGLAVQAAALWNMSFLSADISFGVAAQARLYQAAALPFLFVPINASAYNGLPRNKTAQASSLLNVARNLGGSVGISMSQTLLSTFQQIHQSRRVETLNPSNPAYNDWLAQAQLLTPGDTTTPVALLYQQMQRQVTMLAFIDVFRVLMVLVILVAPIVFLMKPVRAGGGSEGMGH